MTKQQAIDFINVVNAAQPFVPPVLFGPIINSAVARLAIAVANDEMICDVRDPAFDSRHLMGNGAAANEVNDGRS